VITLGEWNMVIYGGGIDSKKNIYSAIGNSGNVIYINPEENIVISVASYFKPTVFDRVDFVQEYIEPFVRRSV